ncbi:MAG: HEAT repeat domain-containing protein, partial [Candidatus Hydrogenedentes bacterium]|nr:HEAT repeat domain-containing protein [Candidatus Hydrogenedentota bacterium]
NKDGIRRDDDDFAVSWVRTYGEGRVFYCSLGHRHEIFWNPAILQHYLDGIQFALGDLAADTTPSAQLPADYAEKAMNAIQTELLDEAIEELPAYNLGDDPSILRFLEEVVNSTFGRAKERRVLAEKLAAILGDSGATFYAKRFVCRQLYHLGVPEVVADVAPLLSDPELSEVARYALERIEAPSVDQAYLDALPKAPGDTKIGLINGLGERKAQVAVEALSELAGNPDPAIASAAILALGKIGGTRAGETLAGLEENLSTAFVPVWIDARLLCADGFLAEGQTDQAQIIYDEVYRSECPDRFRVAALRGIVQAQGDDATVVVVDALRRGNDAIREAAAAVARDVPGGAATQVFAAELSNLLPETQELLLISLAERADPAALGAVTEAAQSEVDGIRNAALEALAVLGNASTVPLLTEVAATTEGRCRELARRALNRMRGLDVNAALVGSMQNSLVSARRAEAARALGERLASETTPDLLEAISDSAPEVRVAALEALATVAPCETLPEIVELIVAAEDEQTRNAAENTAIIVGLRPEDGSTRSEPVLAAFGRMDTGPAAKAALLRVLGQWGDEDALPTVIAAANSRDDEVRVTALRVLSEWPNAAPMNDLLELAQKTSDETERIIALRGYLRMIEMPSDRDAQETLALYREATELAQTTEEKKLVLSGLGKMGHRGAMELIRPYLDDSEVQEEAKLAAEAAQSAGYKTSASVAAEKSRNAIDTNIESRWDTGGKQQPGQWFMLDLGWPESIKQITLDAS